jgi:hypothetical protein
MKSKGSDNRNLYQDNNENMSYKTVVTARYPYMLWVQHAQREGP